MSTITITILYYCQFRVLHHSQWMAILWIRPQYESRGLLRRSTIAMESSPDIESSMPRPQVTMKTCPVTQPWRASRPRTRLMSCEDSGNGLCTMSGCWHTRRPVKDRDPMSLLSKLPKTVRSLSSLFITWTLHLKTSILVCLQDVTLGNSSSEWYYKIF